MTALVSTSHTLMPEPKSPMTVIFRVRGIVQGVGFRPFVYRLAKRYGLSGWVLNDVEGVLIEVSGNAELISSFQQALSSEAPAASLVEAVLELSRTYGKTEQDFHIRESVMSPAITTLISPDLPVCNDCLAELFDPQNPRYHYPFINCTNCGPCYSIIEALPYDRPYTTMKAFAMCEACDNEYHDPANRRFHAQPIACPVCGPGIAYVVNGQETARGDTAINKAARALHEGKILAIKGLGGYHLACNAKDDTAIANLRQRKFRKEKPFALMAKSLESLEPYTRLDKVSRDLLTSSARPIVLVGKGQETLPAAIAPDSTELGVMLAYTPLHHLLFATGAPELLVMTSANRSSEPIAYQDEQALSQLEGIADAFLLTERPIARRIDDSVTSVFDQQPVILRRARGYAPSPVLHSRRFTRPMLALGAGLKNTVTLVTGGYAFVSQHLGDLDNYDAFLAFQETVHDLSHMYHLDLEQTLIVHDLHPAYASSSYASELPGKKLAVQHHEAHIASVLAEHDVWDKAVLGFSFDGAGLGSDGNIWGGEVFYGSLTQGLKRVAHLREALLPGGDAAARNPQQAAVGFLHQLDDDFWQRYLNPLTVQNGQFLIKHNFNTPRTSSIGRLFDTVAALCGFDRKMSFEGQAAMWLETLAKQVVHPVSSYTLPFDGQSWDYKPLLESVIQDKQKQLPPAVIAYKFHHALAQAVTNATYRLNDRYGFDTVVLSGGVWQNKLLHDLALRQLRQTGYKVWWNQKVPPGDGGISLGQAALAAREVD